MSYTKSTPHAEYLSKGIVRVVTGVLAGMLWHFAANHVTVGWLAFMFNVSSVMSFVVAALGAILVVMVLAVKIIIRRKTAAAR